MVLAIMPAYLFEQRIVRGFSQAFNYKIGENHYKSSRQGGAAEHFVY